jgi:hypothetical protein
MSPVLLPTNMLPTREAIQDVFDARDLDCNIRYWDPSLGLNSAAAILRGREAFVRFEVRQLNHQDRTLSLLYPEYCEGKVAIYETVKGGQGMHSHVFSDYLESAVSELLGGVLYFDDSPTPDEPWYLNQNFQNQFESLQFMEFVIRNYEINERFHPNEMPVMPGLSMDMQMWILCQIEFAHIDSDRTYRSLNQDGGYRWLTQEGFEHVQRIEQQTEADHLLFKELGA